MKSNQHLTLNNISTKSFKTVEAFWPLKIQKGGGGGGKTSQNKQLDIFCILALI